MPKYMLSVLNDPAVDFASLREEELKQMGADVDAFNDIVREAGKWVFAGGLESIEAATVVDGRGESPVITDRSEEHTSELQSQSNLVCRLLLEKKKKSRPRPWRCRSKKCPSDLSDA